MALIINTVGVTATTEAVAMAEAGATRGPPRDDKRLS